MMATVTQGRDGVRLVNQATGRTNVARGIDHGGKRLVLRLRELRIGLRTRKVREHAGQTKAAIGVDIANQGRRLLDAAAPATHAGVDFDMDRKNRTELRSECPDDRQVLAIMDRDVETAADEAPIHLIGALERIDRHEHENRDPHRCLQQRCRLVGRVHREHVGSGADQGAGDSRRAESVGISFDDRTDGSGGTDESLEIAKVPGDRPEIDVDPTGRAHVDSVPRGRSCRLDWYRPASDPTMSHYMQDIFDLDKTFADLGLSDELLTAIDGLGFEHPTHVQARLIPVAIEGRDILGQSKTGTGKTAAFGIPLVQLTKADQPFNALVLCPTRELAIQVTHEIRNLSRDTDLRVTAIYGGQRMSVQGPKLQKGPHVIVGTPGRVMDFHRRGALPYDKFSLVVLDEVDRMLDIGFRDDIRRILGGMKQKHQTLFVSATISPEIEKLARQYLKNPEHLVLTHKSSLTVSQVEQSSFSVEPWDKSRLLVHLMKQENPDLALVFCRTKHTVDALTKFLQRKKVDAHAIHGDLHQGKRNRVMDILRSGDLHVLVASDLAARGIDVDDITHVINYDLPEDPEVYVHRIGRTARAGRKGVAWSFVSPGQGDLVTGIEMLTGVPIDNIDAEGFEPGPVPKDIVERREADAQRREALSNDAKRDVAAPPTAAAAEDKDRFPDGLVPAALPARRMGGRLRTRRR